MQKGYFQSYISYIVSVLLLPENKFIWDKNKNML